jgi:uncharacterized protein involved in exopolysaccharide biosynthesis
VTIPGVAKKGIWRYINEQKQDQRKALKQQLEALRQHMEQVKKQNAQFAQEQQL